MLFFKAIFICRNLLFLCKIVSKGCGYCCYNDTYYRNEKINPIFNCHSITSNIFRFGRHNAVQLRILREAVHKWQYQFSIEDQLLTGSWMGHIGKLLRGDSKFPWKDFPAAGYLVEHIHEVRVFKDVLHLTGRRQVLNVLTDTCRDTAPFSKSFPNIHGISGSLFFFQEQMELVTVEPAICVQLTVFVTLPQTWFWIVSIRVFLATC